MSWHWTKGVKKTSSPQRVLTVGWNTRRSLAEFPSQTNTHYLQRWAAEFVRRDRGRWCEPDRRHGLDTSEFWGWVADIARPRSKTWVLVPNVSDFMALFDGWGQVESGFFEMPGIIRADKPEAVPGEKKLKKATLAVGGPTEIVTVRAGKEGGWLTVVGLRNYVGHSLNEVGQQLLGHLTPETAQAVRDGGLDVQPVAVAELLRIWFLGMLQWWKQADAGPWQSTAARLSHTAWRRLHHTHPVLVHDNLDAHQLERDAVFGGRAEVFYYGDVRSGLPNPERDHFRPPPADYGFIPGPVHRLDIRSMYPAILASQNLPVRLIGWNQRPSMSYLEKLSPGTGAIARVTLSDAAGDYPVRLPGGTIRRHVKVGERWCPIEVWRPERIVYPVGACTTTLCGPELTQALIRGRVAKVHEAAVYKLEPAFQQLARWLWMVRRHARDGADIVAEGAAKLLANAFSGRWAQKPARWIDSPGTLLEEPWSYWFAPDPETGRATTWRDIAGLVQYRSDPKDQIKGFPAIFAWVTSHGRSILTGLLRLMPEHTVIQCDTDGLFVTDAGLQFLQEEGMVRGEEMGEIRLVDTISDARFFSPRHYWFDGYWTAAGVRSGYDLIQPGVMRETVRQPHMEFRGKRPDCVRETRREVDLTRIKSLTPIGPDGWACPYGIPLSNLPDDAGTLSDQSSNAAA